MAESSERSSKFRRESFDMQESSQLASTLMQVQLHPEGAGLTKALVDVLLTSRWLSLGFRTMR
jgi:hypothetical protein